MTAVCARKGCDKAGIWRIGFTFEAVGGSPPAQAMSGVKVCQQHREEATFEGLFTPEAVEGIQDGLRAIGRAPADPKSFKLVFIRGN